MAYRTPCTAVGACLVGLVILLSWKKKKCAKREIIVSWMKEKSLKPPNYEDPEQPENQSLTKERVFELRQLLFCGSQSVSYSNSNPLMIVRGSGSKLYDENNVEYLDTRNNVGHVGHSHPNVVLEVAQQLSAINTNTRYLHPNHVRLAHKLLRKCPDPLKRVFFVNSGSEANDLALRLARAKTKKHAVIVVEHAYHGHTTEMINISPYKFAKVGGVGKRDWVHVVSAPDIYRGLYRDDDNAASLYAQQVETVCKNLLSTSDENKNDLAAIFVESGMSVAGVIIPPRGYLQQSFQAVRKAGGVCIADEVQVGFGRLGDSFWAFQQSDVVPDIVTCGKPFGNGMPLAAVITTNEIAEAFEEQGIEYFNTFGGNPVSCAAGLAVLDTIEKEDLMKHASEVGLFLKDSLLALKSDFIGDVRGRGLFLGIDFVLDKKSRAPAPKHASVITTRLKDVHHILTSIDGPNNNVIVMKPPLAFSIDDSKEFLSALEECLSYVKANDLSHVKHTPT